MAKNKGTLHCIEMSFGFSYRGEVASSFRSRKPRELYGLVAKLLSVRREVPGRHQSLPQTRLPQSRRPRPRCRPRACQVRNPIGRRLRLPTSPPVLRICAALLRGPWEPVRYWTLRASSSRRGSICSVGSRHQVVCLLGWVAIRRCLLDWAWSHGPKCWRPLKQSITVRAGTPSQAYRVLEVQRLMA